MHHRSQDVPPLAEAAAHTLGGLPGSALASAFSVCRQLNGLA